MKKQIICILFTLLLISSDFAVKATEEQYQFVAEVGRYKFY